MEIIKQFKIGSSALFSGMQGYNEKSSDLLLIEKDPVGFKTWRESSCQSGVIAEWKEMGKDEFIEATLSFGRPELVGKFLIPEFAEWLQMTIDDLKKLDNLFSKMEGKQAYLKKIYDYYIENGEFELREEQKKDAYSIYQEYREDNKEGEE
jgi:hypothetical protein